MELVLFDDAAAAEWMPFALTRPVGELLFGAFTFRERAARLFGSCAGHVTRAHLRGFEEPGSAPVLDPAGLDDSRPRLFLCSRAVVDWNVRFDPGVPGIVRVGGQAAGCYVPPGVNPPPEFFERPAGFALERAAGGGAAFVAGPGHGGYDLPGRLLENVWDLIAGNAAQIAADFAGTPAPRGRAPASSAPRGVHLVGGGIDRLRIEEGALLEPGVVLDVSTGPIWIEDGATVRAFSRLQGPLFAGHGSTLLGGPYAAVSIGPVSKVHGEIEDSVVLGYSNKAHDGFLGHAYLGRWVNLGALTTNSDLKNNYGPIRVWTPRGEVDTGLTKLGCMLGDHVKTGIGVMLNTGTVIGAGSNVFGAVQPPKYVPPFRWGSGNALEAYGLDRFLGTARTVMERRGVQMSEGMAGVLARAAGAAEARSG
jgi:hypothetical protein